MLFHILCTALFETFCRIRTILGCVLSWCCHHNAAICI